MQRVRIQPSVRSLPLTAAITTLLAGSGAHAHFTMLKPASWLKEDSVGGPQKGSPCGPGNSGPLGDDVSPVPESGMVTEVHAGDTIMVDLQETIYHPGYFRIALAEKRSDFTIPPVDNPSSCAFDLDKVPTGAHDNVLMDGLWKQKAASGSNRHLTQEVKLPDKPCESCTLQIVQVMLNHGLNSCYYYHCANLKILPASGGGAAGAGGTTGASVGAGAAGQLSAGAPAADTTATAGVRATSAGASGSAPTTAGTLATSVISAAAGTGVPAIPAATAASGATGTGTASAAAAGTPGASPSSTVSAAVTDARSPAVGPAAEAPKSSSCSVVDPGADRSSTTAWHLAGLLAAACLLRSPSRRARARR